VGQKTVKRCLEWIREVHPTHHATSRAQLLRLDCFRKSS
jgi:hypothetical protein